MTEPAGAQDPALSATPQQVAVAPPDAANVQQPEAVLPPENSVQDIDDDEGPTSAQLAAMRNAFFSQQQEPTPAAPVETPPVEQGASAAPSAADAPGNFPQYRLEAAPGDKQKDQFLKLLRAGVEPPIATAAVYGTPAPVETPAAEAPPIEAAPSAADAVSAIETELRALAAEPWVEDFELKRTEKMLEHSRAVAAAALNEQRQAVADEDARNIVAQEEWGNVLAKYPRYANPNDAQNVLARELEVAWRATNDPRLNLPNLVTVLADTAAAELFAHGDSRNQSPQHAPVPQAAPAVRFSPAPAGGSPPPPARMWTADQLEELEERDPAEHARLMARARQSAVR